MNEGKVREVFEQVLHNQQYWRNLALPKEHAETLVVTESYRRDFAAAMTDTEPIYDRLVCPHCKAEAVKRRWHANGFKCYTCEKTSEIHYATDGTPHLLPWPASKPGDCGYVCPRKPCSECVCGQKMEQHRRHFEEAQKAHADDHERLSKALAQAEHDAAHWRALMQGIAEGLHIPSAGAMLYSWEGVPEWARNLCAGSPAQRDNTSTGRSDDGTPLPGAMPGTCSASCREQIMYDLNAQARDMAKFDRMTTE